MKSERFSECIKSFIIILFITIYLNNTIYAAETRYPIPSYDGKELEKVRQWEKIWVGKKITTANIDGVKEYLPDTLYEILRISV